MRDDDGVFIGRLVCYMAIGAGAWMVGHNPGWFVIVTLSLFLFGRR